MRNSKQLLPAVVLVLGLFVGAPTAQAVVFSSDGSVTLSNWNTSELLGDNVIVEYGTVGGNTAFLVYWDPTTSTSGLTADAIDMFWYDYTCSGGSYNPDTEACSWTQDAPITTGNPNNRTPYTDLTGSPGAVEDVYLYDGNPAPGTSTLMITGEWDLNAGNALHADGFDMIYSSGRNKTTGNAGNPGGEDPDNALLFVLAGVVDPTYMFAVHVRYGNDCSGYASNAELKDGAEPESNPGCAAVPEPSSVALLGVALFALASLGAWRRRKASIR